MLSLEFPPSLHDSIGFQLNRTALLFRRELLHVLSNDGLQPEQWQILVALVETDGPLAQQKLVELTLTDKHTVSRMLTRMERDGWVQRVANPGDARSQHILLTRKARIRYPKLLSHLHSHFQRLLAQFSETDSKKLLRLLTQVRQSLENTQ